MEKIGRWISSVERQGYSRSAVISALKKKGYSSKDINAAYRHAYQTPIKRRKPVTVHLPLNNTVLRSILVFFVIVAVVYGILRFVEIPSYNPQEHLSKITVPVKEMFQEPKTPKKAISSPCSTRECFAVQFATCSSATLQSTVFSDVEYYHEIIEKNSGGCRILTRYIRHSNLALVGLDMICSYDTSQPFEQSINNPSRCVGLLAEQIS